MNQPFNHRVTLLFTATSEVERKQLMVAFEAALRKIVPYVQSSLDIEEIDAEPGDAGDLV